MQNGSGGRTGSGSFGKSGVHGGRRDPGAGLVLKTRPVKISMMVSMEHLPPNSLYEKRHAKVPREGVIRTQTSRASCFSIFARPSVSAMTTSTIPDSIGVSEGGSNSNSSLPAR